MHFGKMVLPFAATHDIELSYILDSQYENYHFEEDVTGKRGAVFPCPEKWKSHIPKCAIQLFGYVSYDKEIVEDARNAAFL